MGTHLIYWWRVCIGGSTIDMLAGRWNPFLTGNIVALTSSMFGHHLDTQTLKITPQDTPIFGE